MKSYFYSAPRYINRRLNPGADIVEQWNNQIADQGISTDYDLVIAFTDELSIDDMKLYNITIDAIEV